mmetsp:Transcript_1677/g.10282  ORF Transcript_1677/g.10282 Transcript_1677/m.10282 type:complete len:84 (-) Transcript_1677:1373-1624(-)
MHTMGVYTERPNAMAVVIQRPSVRQRKMMVCIALVIHFLERQKRMHVRRSRRCSGIKPSSTFGIVYEQLHLITINGNHYSKYP